MTADTALARYAEDPATAASVEVYTRLQVVKSVLAPDLSDAELTLFAMVAQRSGLDPFSKQIHAVKRKGKVTFQTGIDGYRSIAERTHEYEGSDLAEYGPACECGKEPKGHPLWARVTVYRTGKRPQTGEAYWHEFHPGEQDFMWVKMPRNQLAKCAEALALRKIFPHVYEGIYTNEEMAQAGPAENGPVAAAAAQPDARSRLAARRAALEAPVEPEAPTEPVEEGIVRVPDPEPVATICGHVAGDDGLMAGAVCALAPDHTGAHKNGDGSWPR